MVVALSYIVQVVKLEMASAAQAQVLALLRVDSLSVLYQVPAPNTVQAVQLVRDTAAQRCLSNKL